MRDSRPDASIALALLLGAAAVSVGLYPIFLKPLRTAEVPQAAGRPVPAGTAGAEARAERSVMGPAQLARFFGYQDPVPAPAAAGPTAEPSQPAPAPVAADWLVPLGAVTDELGVSRLYFKNSRTGALLKVREDGTPENGTKYVDGTAKDFVIAVEGVEYVVPRRKK